MASYINSSLNPLRVTHVHQGASTESECIPNAAIQVAVVWSGFAEAFVAVTFVTATICNRRLRLCRKSAQEIARA